jgi:hypothetical protein
MGFLDGPEGVVVVVANEAGDGLEAAAPWVVDEMRVETMITSNVLVVEHDSLDTNGGAVHEFIFTDFLLDLLLGVVLDVSQSQAKEKSD